ncbi:hypothetical protein [Caballeronia sp. BR00000012568055]|uniref:hypothetical protein n=1 Tax=Caballeronia sp. BR00000012568055 TaxID=2918761 RepID=UPI0023F7ABF8|nr:hypothetical protein [Caballeronia sp. BR00000012568055]
MSEQKKFWRFLKSVLDFAIVRAIPSLFCWFFVCLIIFLGGGVLDAATSGGLELPKIASVSSLYESRFLLAFPVAAAVIFVIFSVATVIAKKIRPSLPNWRFLHEPLIEDEEFKHRIYEEAIVQFIALGSVSISVAIHACLSNIFFKTSILAANIRGGVWVGAALWVAAFIWSWLINTLQPAGLPASPTEGVKAPTLVDEDAPGHQPSKPTPIAKAEKPFQSEKSDVAPAPPANPQASPTQKPPETGARKSDSTIK